jgi:hypothetical protein
MNYYEILGVAQDASEDEIKAAFRKLAVEKHPDKGGSTEEFIQLKTAYDTLKSPLLRKDYDLRLKPESVDNTYNTQHDFRTDTESAETTEPTEATRPIDEDYIIKQLSQIARATRLRSILNTFGGLFIGLAGVILTIVSLGFVVFSGLINSGFGMMKRDAWQAVNPYTSLFGVLNRSHISPTAKITDWIKTKRRKSITIFVATLAIIAIVIWLAYFFVK